jgi:hypothetical protein
MQSALFSFPHTPGQTMGLENFGGWIYLALCVVIAWIIAGDWT